MPIQLKTMHIRRTRRTIVRQIFLASCNLHRFVPIRNSQTQQMQCIVLRNKFRLWRNLAGAHAECVDSLPLL